MEMNEETVLAVLASPERTREVVAAAARSLTVLAGPNPTADGDDPAMCARSMLTAAFMDAGAVGEALA